MAKNKNKEKPYREFHKQSVVTPTSAAGRFISNGVITDLGVLAGALISSPSNGLMPKVKQAKVRIHLLHSHYVTYQLAIVASGGAIAGTDPGHNNPYYDANEQLGVMVAASEVYETKILTPVISAKQVGTLASVTWTGIREIDITSFLQKQILYGYSAQRGTGLTALPLNVKLVVICLCDTANSPPTMTIDEHVTWEDGPIPFRQMV